MTDWSGGVDPNAPTFAGPYPPPGGWAPPPAPPADRWQPQPAGWQPQQPPHSGGWPAQQPPPGGPWQPPPGPPFQPPKNRKPLFVTLAAGGAVVLVVAIVLAITLTGRASYGGGSAGDVVKDYLQALANGDAETALSYSADQPASKEFLTDEVLKKQVAQWPITNVRILNDDSTGAGGPLGMAQVHVVATFGDKVSDSTLEVKKDHGSWKLNTAAIKVSPDPASTAGNAAAKTLTFFGKPVGDSTVYVFPGWMDVGTTNPYMTATTKPLLLDQLTMMGLPWLQTTFALSDKGRDAARDQLSAAMANCQKSNLLAPPGCPMSVDPYGLADGTAAWGPADISAVKFDNFDPYRLELTFFGQVKASISVKTTGGATKQGDATQFLSGSADMAKTPPALSFR